MTLDLLQFIRTMKHEVFLLTSVVEIKPTFHCSRLVCPIGSGIIGKKEKNQRHPPLSLSLSLSPSEQGPTPNNQSKQFGNSSLRIRSSSFRFKVNELQLDVVIVWIKFLNVEVYGLSRLGSDGHVS